MRDSNRSIIGLSLTLSKMAVDEDIALIVRRSGFRVKYYSVAFIPKGHGSYFSIQTLDAVCVLLILPRLESAFLTNINTRMRSDCLFVMPSHLALFTRSGQFCSTHFSLACTALHPPTLIQCERRHPNSPCGSDLPPFNGNLLAVRGRFS